jgi:predicted ATPase
MMEVVAQRVSSPALVGRAAEAARLGAAFERAAAGQTTVVVVAGEAGVGKTRLVAELADRVRRQGALALAGGCLDVGDGVVAYAPVVEALRPLPGLLAPEELERVLGGARAELARLVPELAAPGTTPPDGPGAGATVPGRLFELLLGVLHHLAERGPVLLVVEDLHWADRSTRDLLGFLVRNLRGPVALVPTYRSDELHRRHPLRPFLAELERGGRVERLELGRLDRRELAELLGGILGEPADPGLVEEILARSEGNPFFAEELLAARREGVDLPEALRDLLLARVQVLSAATQRGLQVAAVAGQRVDHELLAAVAGQPPERLVEPLREAIGRQVLVVEEGGDGYRFRHALVQEAIYDDLLPVQRGPLHAAYARALTARIERRGGATAPELGQLAHHWDVAHDQGRALLASVRAGQAAEATFALAEAARHYERALELWELAPEAAARSPLDRGSLLQRAAQAAQLAGETSRAVALIEQALAEAGPAGDPRRVGALLERLAHYQWIDGDSTAAMATVQRAVATIPAEPPSAERARALAAHGQMLLLLSRLRAARARCEQAVAAAHEVGDRAVEGHARNSLGTSLGKLGRLEPGSPSWSRRAASPRSSATRRTASAPTTTWPAC